MSTASSANSAATACDPTPYITSVTLTDLNKNPISCGSIQGNSNYYLKISGKVSSYCTALSSGGTVVGTIDPLSTCSDNPFTSPYHTGDIGTLYLKILTPSSPTAIAGTITPYDACSGPDTPYNFNFQAPVYTPGTTITFTYAEGMFKALSNHPLADNISITGAIKLYNACSASIIASDAITGGVMKSCSSSYSSTADSTNGCIGLYYKYLSLQINGTIITSGGTITINGHSYTVVVTNSCTAYVSPC